MRSAVNVGMLPQVIVPDNSHVIGVAKSIGSDIRQGLDKRKAEKEAADNKERAASLAKEIFESRAVGDIPQAVRPQYDPETELRLQQVDLAEKQRLDEIHQKSENAKRATIQASNQRRVLSDAETKANFVELAQLDPQLARFVFQGVTSANEQDRLAVAQEAKRANDLFQNAAYFAQQDLKGGKGGQLDAFLVDAIRQESARGGDVSRLYQMYKASPDERIGLIQRNLALSGTVLRNPEVEKITALEQAKLDDADADRALKAREVAIKEREQSLKEQQAKDKPSKSEEKAEAKRQEDLQAYQVYQVAMDNLKNAFSEINTGAISGRIWGASGDHQTAQGMRDQMAPVLKKMFREAGEGTFTDGDRIALMAMLPETTDSEEAVSAKIIAMDQLVTTKLGINSPSFGAVGGSLPQGITEADIQYTMQKHGVTRQEVLQKLGGQ